MAWFKQWTTEIVVTNHRVIYKKGFIRRHTAEMNMDKVESVAVDQTIMGRVLGKRCVGTLRPWLDLLIFDKHSNIRMGDRPVSRRRRRP
jgi:hypothetical protein